MELGNMIFGNSRGPVEVPHKLVESDVWSMLVNDVLQVEDYHCSIGTHFEDKNNNYMKRTNKITPNEYGGYALMDDNNEIIFEIFPYWWGDCTCGAWEHNEEIYEKMKKKYFTEEEYEIYSFCDDYCEDDCECADKWNLSNEEKLKYCTCGAARHNIEMVKKQEKLKKKSLEFESEVAKNEIDHKDDCLLIKHNFVYHPGRDDEFWIDWYKYPFRDSHMNKNYTIEEIENIFRICIKEFMRINNSI